MTQRWPISEKTKRGVIGALINILADPQSSPREKTFKHKYLMPLDDEMRKQIEPLRKPYPKRVRSVDSDTATVQVAEGGANPTRTLDELKEATNAKR